MGILVHKRKRLALICLRQLDAGFMLDDLVVFDAHFCHAVGSELAHADTNYKNIAITLVICGRMFV